MTKTLSLVTLALVVIAGCSDQTSIDPRTLADGVKGKPGAAASTGTPSGASSTRPGAPAIPQTPLAEQIPTQERPLRRANALWRMAAPFAAAPPTVTANERHSAPVTGMDCLSCHSAGGTAPAFAFAGTIALGKQWTRAPRGWRPNIPAGTPRREDDYDDYDSYDDYGDDYGDCYGDGYDDYDSYDDYDTYDSYDDYGDEGGRCGRKGWPVSRDEPSTHTEVRIVGADGYVFETMTDRDGNFWFKSSIEVKQPAFTGVRYGEFKVAGASFGNACGSCHESGSKDNPGRIWTWDGPMPR